MRQLLLALFGRIGRGVPHVLGSGLPLMGLALVVVGCASPSLMPEAQAVAIKHRERALASHADAIHAAISQSGQCGRPGLARRQGWPSGRPAGRQSGRCLGALHRVAGERDRSRVGAAGAHLRASRGHTQGSRDRDPERPATSRPSSVAALSGQQRTGASRNDWTSYSASSPSRSGGEAGRSHWPPRARRCRPR